MVKLPLTAAPLLWLVSYQPLIRFQPVPMLTTLVCVVGLTTTRPLVYSRFQTVSPSAAQPVSITWRMV